MTWRQREKPKKTTTVRASAHELGSVSRQKTVVNTFPPSLPFYSIYCMATECQVVKVEEQ